MIELLELIYKDLIAQVPGGVIGLIVWGSGWFLSYGLFRGLRFLYSELSTEREKVQKLNDSNAEQAKKYEQSVSELTKIIDDYQEKENWQKVITTLTENLRR